MTEAVANWTEANQKRVALELQWLAARLANDTKREKALDRKVANNPPMSPPSAIELIADAFGLSAFERALLLLCAGVELDGHLADRVAAAGRGRAVTFSLALATLREAHWSALTPVRPLRRWRLIELEPGTEIASAALHVDERILHFLAGINYLDPRLQPFLARGREPAVMAAAHRGVAEKIADDWRVKSDLPRLVHFVGDDFPGAEDVAAAAMARLGLQLHIVAAESLSSSPIELDGWATLWEREAVLLPSALLVQCGENSPPPPIVRLVERLDVPLFVVVREPLLVNRAAQYYELQKPAASEQKALWRSSLGSDTDEYDEALETIASQFRLSARTIELAASAVRTRIAAGEVPAGALHGVCRGTGRRRLDELASRLSPNASWDDLVLPAAQIGVLRHIAAQVRQRRRVYDEWGFGRRGERGLGVAVLFSGESGTGKTMAAEVLATELNLDLYRIDLSSVVSKYIGETEKNLRRVFDAAEDSGAILLFDEADALFGKRSDVKDSHDRYANIEISYLLQRMEAYRGLAILTTNLKSALDTAFQRRLRFIIQFPFPDAEQREAIWRRAFPTDTPIQELDFGKLARLNIPGGAVRNISLNAAFLAAEAGERLGMRHLLQAAQADRAKLEKPLSEMETRGWV